MGISPTEKISKPSTPMVNQISKPPKLVEESSVKKVSATPLKYPLSIQRALNLSKVKSFSKPQQEFQGKLKEFLRVSDEYNQCIDDMSYQEEGGEFSDASFELIPQDAFSESNKSEGENFESDLQDDHICLCGYTDTGRVNCTCKREKQRRSKSVDDKFQYLKFKGLTKTGRLVPTWAVDKELLISISHYQKQQAEYNMIFGEFKPESLQVAFDD